MKKLRIALIGQGRSGRDIHGNFLKHEDNNMFDVVAVVDALEERRIRAKEEWGCDVYASHEELYGREDIDVVLNSTFSHYHYPVTKDLLEHGFNVICEKPFVKTYEEGCDLIRIAKENGVMLNVFQQSRFAPTYVKLKEIIASGVLGEIKQVSLVYNGFARRWDWQTALSFNAGSVRNSGPHPLDQAMDLLGFPEDATVFSKLDTVNTFGDAEDYAKIIITVPNKPLIDIEISSCDAYNKYLFKVHASKGGLICYHNGDIEYKYFDAENAPKQKLILTPLVNEEGLPAYCKEELSWTEEKINIEGSAFFAGTKAYYTMIYNYLVNGEEMAINPTQVLSQLKVIDKIHAQNPLERKF